ncbi:GNAT family N-acetyltransferase [Allobranchiibius sp. CTAmp26]|uniref:GNAT family N-acetyltransferase n=1 Tax=Allobranchiibius sp. CTAmp26 TaxID=2815214 RepID=UPI001AA15006|nr:GNAT family N-acetyltransferase [Allobranchiibius sp. CTAmp26]MBO1756130.1 GNAT family N-acetyltransferase [Allobranchiibius sp. CTAmp26]
MNRARPPRSLLARGDRVWVRTVVHDDLAGYQRAVRGSWDRIGAWNPVSAVDLEWHLGRQSTEHRTFLIHATEPTDEHDIVGKVNVSNVVRGRFQNGTMGYDAYDPYAGRGLFAEGLRLVVDLAFAGEGRGMNLHRVEANVRPGNTRSAGVLRSLGFRREGHVRSMLLLESGDEPAQWRDHDAYAVHRGEWPATPYAAHRPARMALLVDGIRGAGPAEPARLAAAVAAELGLPLFPRGLVPDEAIWGLLAASPVGGVVEGAWSPEAAASVHEGLERAGFDPAIVPRMSDDGRFDDDGTDAPAPVDASAPLQPGDVIRLALRVRAAFA